jgi:hypothetical protein
MSFGVIRPTFRLAFVMAVALLAIDLLAWRLVSKMFDRERLVTGAKPARRRFTRRFGPLGLQSAQEERNP